MDLSDEDLAFALGKVRAAWKDEYPDSDMPGFLHQAKEVLMDTTQRYVLHVGSDATGFEVPGHVAAGIAKQLARFPRVAGTPTRTADHKPAGGRKKLSAAVAHKHAKQHPKPVAGCEVCADPYVVTLKMPKQDPRANYRKVGADIEGEHCAGCRFWRFGTCSLIEGAIEADWVCNLYLAPVNTSLESSSYRERTMATAMTRFEVFAEIEKAAATYPGDSPEQKRVAYYAAHPEVRVAYEAAPDPTPTPEPVVAPAKPLTGAAAQVQTLAEAKVASGAAPTIEQARVQVYGEQPALRLLIELGA
jgi:hypothetical protein